MIEPLSRLLASGQGADAKIVGMALGTMAQARRPAQLVALLVSAIRFNGGGSDGRAAAALILHRLLLQGGRAGEPHSIAEEMLAPSSGAVPVLVELLSDTSCAHLMPQVDSPAVAGVMVLEALARNNPAAVCSVLLDSDGMEKLAGLLKAAHSRFFSVCAELLIAVIRSDNRRAGVQAKNLGIPETLAEMQLQGLDLCTRLAAARASLCLHVASKQVQVDSVDPVGMPACMQLFGELLYKDAYLAELLAQEISCSHEALLAAAKHGGLMDTILSAVRRQQQPPRLVAIRLLSRIVTFAEAYTQPQVANEILSAMLETSTGPVQNPHVLRMAARVMCCIVEGAVLGGWAAALCVAGDTCDRLFSMLWPRPGASTTAVAEAAAALGHLACVPSVASQLISSGVVPEVVQSCFHCLATLPRAEAAAVVDAAVMVLARLCNEERGPALKQLCAVQGSSRLLLLALGSNNCTLRKTAGDLLSRALASPWGSKFAHVLLGNEGVKVLLETVDAVGKSANCCREDGEDPCKAATALFAHQEACEDPSSTGALPLLYQLADQPGLSSGVARCVAQLCTTPRMALQAIENGLLLKMLPLAASGAVEASHAIVNMARLQPGSVCSQAADRHSDLAKALSQPLTRQSLDSEWMALALEAICALLPLSPDFHGCLSPAEWMPALLRKLQLGELASNTKIHALQTIAAVAGGKEGQSSRLAVSGAPAVLRCILGSAQDGPPPEQEIAADLVQKLSQDPLCARGLLDADATTIFSKLLSNQSPPLPQPVPIACQKSASMILANIAVGELKPNTSAAPGDVPGRAIRSLVACVSRKATNEDVRCSAIRGLGLIAACNVKGARAVCHERAMHAIVRAVGGTPSDTAGVSAEAAAVALARIASSGKEQCIAIARSGGVEATSAALSSTHDAVRCAAADAMAALSCCPDVRRHIIHAGCAKSLVQLMLQDFGQSKEEGPMLQHCMYRVATVLARLLLSKDVSVRRSVAESGALLPLLNCLMSPQPAHTPGEEPLALLQATVSGPLPDILRDGCFSPGARANAAKAIAVAAGSPAGRRAAVDGGCIPRLVGLMAPSASARERSSAMLALKALSADDRGRLEAVRYGASRAMGEVLKAGATAAPQAE